MLLRCIVHIGFQKFVDRLVRVESHEMAVARSDVQFETVRVSYKPNKLIRNDYGFNIHAVDVRIAVYFSETILFIYGIVDFRNGVSAACLFVYTFVERTVN